MATSQAASKHLDDLAGRYLTFSLANTTYGVELLHVVEIVSIQQITTVPNVPKYIRGIINLRGKIIPVVDMRIKFQKEEAEYDERTCIIVIDIGKIQAGLIVDRVSDVLTFEQESLSGLPEFEEYNKNKFLGSIGRVGDDLIMNIDCRKIFLEDTGV